MDICTLKGKSLHFVNAVLVYRSLHLPGGVTRVPFKELISKIKCWLFSETGSIWEAFSGSSIIQLIACQEFASDHSSAFKCLQTALSLPSSLAVAFQFISIMIRAAAVNATCIVSFCFPSMYVSLTAWHVTRRILIFTWAKVTSHEATSARTRRARWVKVKYMVGWRKWWLKFIFSSQIRISKPTNVKKEYSKPSLNFRLCHSITFPSEILKLWHLTDNKWAVKSSCTPPFFNSIPPIHANTAHTFLKSTSGPVCHQGGVLWSTVPWYTFTSSLGGACCVWLAELHVTAA